MQFGARANLYAAAYGFNVTGEAGFDVLIQLLPFHFLAEFFAGMQLRKGSRNLFKVKVEGALEGPLPLSVRAKCTLRDPLVGRLDPRQRHAGRRPGAAAAARGGCLRAAARGACATRRAGRAELPAGQIAHRRRCAKPPARTARCACIRSAR